MARARAANRTRPTFRALQYREFRLYLFGLVASFVGTYMQQVAEGWLVYRITNSAFALGLVGFVILVPLAPLTLLAGVVADRFPRRGVLLLSQIGQIIPPFVLAALTWSHQVQLWHVIVVDLTMSAFASIDQPVRQALLAETVGPGELENAIAISTTGFNVARVIGPAVAGVIVAVWGEAVCFALNGVSFLLIAAALLAMHLPERLSVAREVSFKTNITDGARYLGRAPVLLAAIASIVIINLFIVPYQTLLPIFARDIVGSGAPGLGFLVMAAGIGAILGSLAIAHSSSGGQSRALIWLGLAAPVALVGFTFFRNMLLACLALILVSGAVVALKVVAYTLVQTRVQDDLRGRVMSVLTLSDAGMPRSGGLFAGLLASLWGAPLALQLGAVGCLLGTLALNQWIPSLRRAPAAEPAASSLDSFPG
ncbi:MAG: MFS transporter [Chloroflexi bacterium]|nr:MFS transporter [Chloroflexota bacterium]